MASLHLFLARRAPPLGNVWCGSAAGARAGAVREPHQTGIIHPSSPTHENENPTSHNFAAELALPSVHRAAKANMCGLAQAKKPTPTERRPADKGRGADNMRGFAQANVPAERRVADNMRMLLGA